MCAMMCGREQTKIMWPAEPHITLYVQHAHTKITTCKCMDNITTCTVYEQKYDLYTATHHCNQSGRQTRIKKMWNNHVWTERVQPHITIYNMQNILKVLHRYHVDEKIVYAATHHIWPDDSHRTRQVDMWSHTSTTEYSNYGRTS